MKGIIIITIINDNKKNCQFHFNRLTLIEKRLDIFLSELSKPSKLYLRQKI